MTTHSRHLSEWIDRPAPEVYAYAADPANLPRWAPGLGSSVERVDGEWFVQTPAGRGGVTFAPPNQYGVLDHDVALPSSEVVHNPMRVLPDGQRCEVVFTLRRRPDASTEQFARDAELVVADLARLKRVVEAASGQD